VLLLGNAHFYSALMAAAYLLAFPGAIVPGRPLLGAPESIAWIFHAWIAGFAFLTLIAVMLEAGWSDEAVEPAAAATRSVGTPAAWPGWSRR
jgi:hypothetical protein